MPLSPNAITQAILSAGSDLKGPSWVQLATAIGIAVASWAQLPANLAIQGVTVGGAGTGTVTGKLSVTPSALPVAASVAAAGLIGVNAASLSRAVGLGIAAAFNGSATYQGVSAGVGTGTDISKVVTANAPSLIAALGLAASSTGLVGVNISRICTGLGPGIATLLLTGTGAGVVTGPTGPAPGSGTSVSRVF